MSVFESLQRGIRLANRSKRIIVWILLASLSLVAVPTLILSAAVEDSLGKSEAGQQLAEGYSDRWFQEYNEQASGLAATFSPTLTGIGAVLDGYDGIVSEGVSTGSLAVLGIGLAYSLLWVFLAGGILTVYHEEIGPSFAQLLTFSSEYFGRFLRLFILTGITYLFLYRTLAPGLDWLVDELSREVIDERIAFAWTFLKWIPLLGVALATNLVADYTKILLVLERRRSVLLALLRALRLVWSSLGRVVLLYALLFLIGSLGFFLYWLIAPGVSDSSWIEVLGVLVLGQLFIVWRIWVRLTFYASQLELCRSLR